MQPFLVADSHVLRDPRRQDEPAKRVVDEFEDRRSAAFYP